MKRVTAGESDKLKRTSQSNTQEIISDERVLYLYKTEQCTFSAVMLLKGRGEMDSQHRYKMTNIGR